MSEHKIIQRTTMVACWLLALAMLIGGHPEQAHPYVAAAFIILAIASGGDR